MSQIDSNFSTRSVPDEWIAASADAPHGDEKSPLIKKTGGIKHVPSGAKPDLMTGFLAGLAMALVAGFAWYAIEIDRVFTTEWLPIPLSIFMGLLIPIAVRLGAGKAGTDLRATISVVLYIAAVIAVAYAIERELYTALYGTAPSFSSTERYLVANRATEPVTLAGWGIGLYLSAHTSYLIQSKYKRKI